MTNSEREVLIASMPEYKRSRIDELRRKAPQIVERQIVFAGSSLMQGFPIESFVQDLSLSCCVYNQGISGFTIPELEMMLDLCILDPHPKRLFINIGTNDLTNSALTCADVVGAYEALLDKILLTLPKLEIYPMAWYPVNFEAATEELKPALRIRTNERINEANTLLRQMSERRGFRYIDVNRGMKDEQGRLRAEFTYEGMHIRPEGYAAIMDDLLPYLTETYPS